MHIEQLQVKIGKTLILSNINADFKDGNVSVVIGRNGSGKTTLLRCAAGLIKPSTGKVLLDSAEDGGGKTIEQYSIKELSERIAYLPQTLPKPAVTVFDLVAMGLGQQPLPQTQEKVKKAIARVGMQGFEERLVCHLSGGERALAFLAMLIARRTKVVILDEPFASLDVQAVRKVTGILKDLASEGVAVILSVHDIPRALEIADAVLLLDRGKSIYYGEVQMANNPKLQAAIEECFGIRITTAVDAQGHSYVVEQSVEK